MRLCPDLYLPQIRFHQQSTIWSNKSPFDGFTVFAARRNILEITTLAVRCF